MAGRLEGKTALVTGGGRGIGRGIVHLFAKEGARVLVADNGCFPDGTGADARVCDAVVAEVRAMGGTAIADDGDVADRTAAGRMIDKALDVWGKLDILVNVAGNVRPCTIADASEEDFDAVIRVHLRGTFNTTHFAARHWVKRKQFGRLINMSSRAGILQCHPTILPYSTAKAGVIGFTRACANALVAYGVTANAITPSVATRMEDSLMPKTLQQYRETGTWQSEAAKGTDRDPAHAAPIVAFLASERAGHITGRVFGAYGGRYTLWTLPEESALDVKLTWPQDYEGMFDAFDATLGRDLALTDLPYPMGSLDPAWKQYGAAPPRWDFKTRP